MKKEKKPNIFRYLGKHKLGIVAYCLTTLLNASCGIFYTLALARVIEYISFGVVENFDAIIIVMLFTLGVVVIEHLSQYFNTLIYIKVSTSVMTDLNYDLARQAFKLDSKTYSDHGTGVFVQRIVHDPENIVNYMVNVIDITSELIMAAVMLIYIMTINVYVTLILVASMCIGLLIEFLRIRYRNKAFKQVRSEHDKINSLTTEIVRSEMDIKSMGLEDKLSEVSRQSYNSYGNTRQKFFVKNHAMFQIRNFFCSLMVVVVLIFSIYLMRADLMTLAAFMIIYSNNRLQSVVWQVGQLANQFVDMKVAHGRMFALFDENEFVTEKFGKKKVDNVAGKIEFKNVSYAYREYEYESKNKKHITSRTKKVVSENKIFKNLSFTIEPNTTVAFVGKSGSGKSTILNLMSKMFVVDKGEVLIDGININDFDKASLRKAISLVNQFPYIFDMSIKENLLLAKADATDKEINDAIKKASLAKFIKTLPNGLETKVGESGVKLSGGQKQRLAIARALLRKSSIIIFDESTSSLDNFAQKEVKKSIDHMKGKSTIVIVAHRLSTIKDADEIFFLEDGKILDKGTFDELFDRNEKFKAMFLAENI